MKADSPIIPDLIVISVNAVHSANAAKPISLREAGVCRVFRFLPPQKALVPIEVTPSSTTTLVI